MLQKDATLWLTGNQCLLFLLFYILTIMEQSCSCSLLVLNLALLGARRPACSAMNCTYASQSSLCLVKQSRVGQERLAADKYLSAFCPSLHSFLCRHWHSAVPPSRDFFSAAKPVSLRLFPLLSFIHSRSTE